jgi:hypothetical protein
MGSGDHYADPRPEQHDQQRDRPLPRRGLLLSCRGLKSRTVLRAMGFARWLSSVGLQPTRRKPGSKRICGSDDPEGETGLHLHGFGLPATRSQHEQKKGVPALLVQLVGFVENLADLRG